MKKGSVSILWGRFRASRVGWVFLVTNLAILLGFWAVVLSGILALPWLMDESTNNSEVVLGVFFPLVLLALSFGFAFFMQKKRKVKLFDFLVLRKPRKNVFWLTPLMLFIYVVVLVISTLILQEISPELAGQEQEVANTVASLGGPKLALMILSVGILTPVAEEIFFRGFLISMYVRRLGYPAAILLSSVLFGLAHGQLNVGMDTFIFGLILGFLTWKTDSIYPAIGLHMLKNCLALYVILS